MPVTHEPKAPAAPEPPDGGYSSAEQGAGMRGPGTWQITAALLPFALGYLLSYLFRAVNAVVAPDLVKDVGLTASELGLLTAAYLASFAVFQLPLGVMLDRFGPRRVQAGLVALGAAGSLLFALAESVASLTLSRALIGIAFSGGLMASFKAVVIWVPEQRRALVNSCVMFLGGLGLMFATTPLELASHAYGWRAVFVGLAVATLLTAMLILTVVPERATPATSVAPLGQQIRQAGQIFSDRVFLSMAPLLASTAGTHIAIQTLWAGPWFRDVGGLDRLGVANSLLAMAASLSVGFLLTGFVADRLARRGIGLLTTMLGFMSLYLASQVVLLFAPAAASVALPFWCIFAMTGHVAVLAYPWLSRHFGVGLSGRSNTAMNWVMFVWAFTAQFGIGAIINMFPGKAGAGYQPLSYQVAFGAVLAVELAALAWYLANLKRIKAAQPQ